MTKENTAKPDDIARFFPDVADSSSITVHCMRQHFAASALCRAVEDADARVLNLNVTDFGYDDGLVTVSLRIDHRDPARVLRSLERYGYRVQGVQTTVLDDDTLRSRYNQLMKMLDL